jgi:hypothetical protein
MFFRRHANHNSPQSGPEIREGVKVFRPSIFGGGEYGDSPFEEISPSKGGPTSLASRDGMAAQEPAAPRELTVDRFHNYLLGAPDVGNETSFWTVFGYLADMFRNLPHWRTNEY